MTRLRCPACKTSVPVRMERFPLPRSIRTSYAVWFGYCTKCKRNRYFRYKEGSEAV